MDGAGTVKELQRGLRLGEGVTGDEGEEGYGLSGSRGHLKEAVALGI